MQRYIFIRSDGDCATSDYLIEPNWEDISAIIDLSTMKYTSYSLWPKDNESPDWKEMEEDHL